MNGLFYSCRRAAELLSQAMDEPLGALTRLRLRMHLSMCRDCARVEEQLGELRRLAGELGFMGGPAGDAPASDPPAEITGAPGQDRADKT